jgi:hypothetical protein
MHNNAVYYFNKMAPANRCTLKLVYTHLLYKGCLCIVSNTTHLHKMYIRHTHKPRPVRHTSQQTQTTTQLNALNKNNNLHYPTSNGRVSARAPRSLPLPTASVVEVVSLVQAYPMSRVRATPNTRHIFILRTDHGHSITELVRDDPGD